MKNKSRRANKNDSGRQGKVKIRKDLQDASQGKDLSYLNEMPQMGGYEGVKAGVPPQKRTKEKDGNDMPAES